MVRTRVILLFFPVLLAGCATDAGLSSAMMPLLRCQSIPPDAHTYDKIIGGREVGFYDPDQQNVVQIKIRRGSRDSICTASLIRDRVLLTAAHCVKDADEINAFFVTSEGCPVNSRQKITISEKEVLIHPEFDGSPQSFADLALVKLNSDAPKDQLRLKLVGTGDEFSDEFLLLGFGITDEKSKDAEVLRRVLKPKAEISVREKIVVIDQRPGSGFCRGDSGAPLLAMVWTEPKILAINSATVGTAENNECHTMSVAMNAQHFAPWLTQHADDLDRKGWLARLRSSIGL